MPGTTPVFGFPYPEPTDLVADYPALGQDLAEDIENNLVYTTFNPTWIQGLTTGNGTQAITYATIGKFVHCAGTFTLGSTSAVTGTFKISLPVNRNVSTTAILGTASFADTGTATYVGFALSTSNSDVFFFAETVSGAYIREGNVSATAPFTWTTGDIIAFNLYYRAA